VLDWAIQAHGGGGMSGGFPVAYMYAHSRTLRFADGPDEVHRNAIAQAGASPSTSQRRSAEPGVTRRRFTSSLPVG